MKTRKKISARLLAIMFIAALLLPLAWNTPVEAAETKQIDVLFSHDTHSHLNSFSTIVDGEQKEVGGFARIKTLIDEKKQEDPDTLVLDGGDFSMGTLIQTVYDMEAAKDSGETVPALAVCNVDWDGMEQDGRWELTSYELIPVSEEIKPDQATQEQIDALMDTVDKNYLSDFGYTREEVLAENDVEFNSLEEMGTKHEELNLGDIMSDAYIYAVENSEYYDGDPVDVAVVPSGTVRDTYTKGDITVEDVFNSFSLGIGKDGVAGYPLISAYLTGKELKLAAEVDASVSDFMTTARLYCSGLNFAYNPHRMILNKVTGS